MKNKLLTLLFTLLAGSIFAQGIPQGMNYQAVARDKSGAILADQEIFLKVSLLSEPANTPVVYYSEVQRVVTNKFGLFTAVVGKGSLLSGEWYRIPWSSKEIWMDLSVKLNLNDEFISISNAKLLAVPYAYHAGTAAALTGGYTPYIIPGSTGNGIGILAAGPVKSDNWSCKGNLQAYPPDSYLGNGDSLDLMIKTNGIERMKIVASGNISMKKSLDIGVDLTVARDVTVGRNLFVKANGVIDSNFTVKRNVDLNTLGGATTNYGPFTVGNVSPSVLTGSLRVDQITNLQNGLNVNNVKPTLLTGTLRVNNATDLYSSLTVNSGAATALTGSLRVDSNATLKQHLTLDNAAYNSFTTTDGALVVAGGFGLGKNLNVGGDAKFGGKTSFAGQVKITDASPSVNDTTGALLVTGGAAIGKQLRLGGAAYLKDSLDLIGQAMLHNILTVQGATALQSTLAVTGATTLSSTLAVTGITTLSNKLNANGQVTITANPGSGNQSNYADYPLQVSGSQQGIAIKVTGSSNRSSSSANNNNYVSFWNEDGTMWGRIEGETESEMKNNNSDYIGEDNQYTTDIIFGSLDIAFGAYNVIVATSNVLSSVSSSTACVGLGACVTTPIPSWIVGSAAQLVLAIAAEATTAAALGVTANYYSEWKDSKISGLGVTYESGAGDYAEYLMKASLAESFVPGDIVGMKGGLISKNIAGAEKMMVISKKPIVLGNMPTGNKADYEKVAFLGQVPVKVFGKVNVGDYILPNGMNNGVGVAVNPADIKAQDIRNIVGIAWSGSSNTYGITTINVAVGLNVNDNQKVVDQLQTEVNALKDQLADMNGKLDRILSGNTAPASSAATALTSASTHRGDILEPADADVIYHQLTQEEVIAAADQAKQQAAAEGIDVNTNAFWVSYTNDPAFKDALVAKILEKVDAGIANARVVNRSRFNNK